MRVTIDGVTKPLAQWAREAGISWERAYYRIHVTKWSPKEALRKPRGPIRTELGQFGRPYNQDGTVRNG